jgi:hypothetical protein
MEGDKLVTISEPVTARPKTYSTGSKGWYVFGKVTVEGQRCQLSGNVVVIGSKNKTTEKRRR